MRYVVFTAKHHEGFAMYRSSCDPFNIVQATPFGRDPLLELAAACQRQGLKLGLYYSQDLDWHHPDGGDPGRNGPQGTNFGMSWGNDWDYPDRSAKDYDRYFRAKVLPQVRELLTQYGPVALLWFDCPLTISREQSLELWELVRSLQPACLVNTRLGHGLGDYGSLGDNQVPSGRVSGIWETPATLNDTWGWKYFDHAWKSSGDVLGVLAGLASRNVNYLLNVGPQPDGCLPAEASRVLEELGEWMERNGEALHGTRASPFPCDPDFASVTRRPAAGDRPAVLYLLLGRWQAGLLRLRGLRTRVSAAYELSPPRQPLVVEQVLASGAEELALRLPAVAPAGLLPVLALELESEPVVDQRLLSHDGQVLRLPAGSATVHAESAAVPLPRLDVTGILVDWLDTRAWVAWEAEIPAAGAYEVEVVTSAVHHSAPWQGGHGVRLEADGAAIECRLQLDEADRRPESRYYAQGTSRCGQFTFGRAGPHTLTLKARHIQDHGGVGLALVALRLRRV
jgi:alpha-L-fucosidase